MSTNWFGQDGFDPALRVSPFIALACLVGILAMLQAKRHRLARCWRIDQLVRLLHKETEIGPVAPPSSCTGSTNLKFSKDLY